MFDFDYEIQGQTYTIVCLNVDAVPPWPGSIENCPSDLDYYGYFEVEYEVRNEEGELSKVDLTVDEDDDIQLKCYEIWKDRNDRY